MTTLGADVKKLVDDAATGLTAVYRQAHVPDDATFPYGSFLDPIGDGIALSGDARTLARRRLIQLDVYQAEETEDDDLVGLVMAAIDGQRTAGGLRARVIDVLLVPGPETEEDVVHHAITVSLARVL